MTKNPAFKRLDSFENMLKDLEGPQADMDTQSMVSTNMSSHAREDEIDELADWVKPVELPQPSMRPIMKQKSNSFIIYSRTKSMVKDEAEPKKKLPCIEITLNKAAAAKQVAQQKPQQPQIEDEDDTDLFVYSAGNQSSVSSKIVNDFKNTEQDFDAFALGKRTHRQALLHKGHEITHRRIVKRVRKAEKIEADPAESELEKFLNEIEDDEVPPMLSRRNAIVGLARGNAMPQLQRVNAVIMMNQRNEALYI